MARAVVVPLLMGAALLAYHNSFAGAFVLDDHREIEQNLHIRRLWRPDQVIAGNLNRPVVIYTLAFNYALGGLNPAGYHVFNLAIHALAALVLFGLVRRTLTLPQVGPRYRTSVVPLAFAVALLWTVHPLQTSSVTYVIQRGESLMAFFYLLMLYALTRSAQGGRPRLWQTIAVASCAVGMGTKPVMMTAPLAALLFDRAFLSPSFAEALRRRPFAYAGLGATWVMLAAIGAVALFRTTTAGFGITGINSFQYGISQPGVIVHYLRLALWPDALCFDYAWPVARTAGEWLPASLLVGSLLAATFIAWRRQPTLGFLGAFFFLVLGPTSSVIPIADLAVEHRMYLPLAPLLVLLVLGAYEGLGALERRLGRAGLCHRLGVALAGVAALTLAGMTVRRNADYGSELRLWQDTVAKRPENVRAQITLGSVLAGRGELAEAMKHYRTALRLDPRSSRAHANLATALMVQAQLRAPFVTPQAQATTTPSGQADLAEAVRHYRRALKLDPEQAQAHNNLGSLLAQKGRTAEAMEHYRQAIRIAPEFASAHFNLAVALAGGTEADQARRHLNEALRLDPSAFGDAARQLEPLIGSSAPREKPEER